ncbi:hypothetical protein HMPREF1866_00742 [Lachnoanaerobaculum saburreum]|uniref:Uncharacterized protein n=1 Tax=Lachnoanaerobaculum saburreum TaxID=467210 RepID=A0A133ZXC2_9FIRM|nr:hypothetical protein HMPREF1866_00742 [Lachnoanaerobaculum saburreum]
MIRCCYTAKISIFSYVDKNNISVYNKREHTFDGGCYEKG